jgi:LysM repeat protein
MRSRLIGVTVATGLAALVALGPILVPAARATEVVVRAGDTLSGIAARHGVSVERLVALNHLTNPNRLRPGQRLQLSAPPAPRSKPTASLVHVVRPGEHLTGIARRYSTSVAALVAANHLVTPSYIRAGARLVIPGRSSTPSRGTSAPAKPAKTVARAAPLTYRVRAGDSLWTIARRHGTTISAIVTANRLRSASYIRTGQLLRIPVTVSAGPSQVDAPKATLPSSMAARVARRGAVRKIIEEEARRFGVPVGFALAVAWQESGWQQGVRSGAGAIGVMQLLPATGDWVGAAMLHQRVNLGDTRQNVRAGVRLLAHYMTRYRGDKAKVLAAYYQGQTAVDRHGIYAVSRPYIASILRLEQLFS